MEGNKKIFSLDAYNPNDKKSMYIEASAGTGKTYTIENLVKKLVENGTALEKILIVTYTDKAVGELKDRIRKSLLKIQNKHRKIDVDNAPIFTIHSFCQKTLEEFAFTAKKTLSLALIDEGDVAGFIDRWIRDTLKNDEAFVALYDSNDKKDSFIEKLKKDFIAAVDKYYLGEAGKEDAAVVTLDGSSSLASYSIDWSDAAFKRLLHPASVEDLFVIPGFESNFNTLISSDIARVREFAEHIKEIVKTRHAYWYNGTTYKKAKWNDPVRDSFDFFRQLKNDYQNFSFGGFFYASKLRTLYLAWQNEKARNKQQTFNDMIRSVREAVCESDSALKKQLQKKYTYAIIDEFQDTNQKQWDIFKTIFMSDGPAVPDAEKHTLIVVGDPKQSIFSFQGADVNVYNNAVKEIAAQNADAAYELKENYRSSPGIIEACNALFMDKPDGIRFFDAGAGISFSPSRIPGAEDEVKLNAVFKGEETAPFWIVEDALPQTNAAPAADGAPQSEIVPVSSEKFAETAVRKIIECCLPSAADKSKTNLQVFDKEAWKTLRIKKLRNVSFKDFAVLTKTSSEMIAIENVMKRYGVPFSRYKNGTLFAGIECMHWTALLNAICAGDFNGRNRRILSEALFTKFFGVSLDHVEDKEFDEPTCDARQSIIIFQRIAKKRQWARLIEVIFQKTRIEENLSQLSGIQSLSKFRQIGSYIAEYLYKNACSLEDACRHLSRLAQASEGAEDNGNLIAKGTDFDCVQVITMHSSKGLEFPVVIGAGGFKDRITTIPQAYLYHDAEHGNKAKLSFYDSGKAKMLEEEQQEWQRLFYVAYTRASSLMILPFYEDWQHKNILKFLGKNFTAFMENPANKRFYQTIRCPASAPGAVQNSTRMPADPDADKEIQRQNVQYILSLNDMQNERTVHAGVVSEAAQKQAQEEKNRKLAGTIFSRSLKKHSYSSLAHGKHTDDSLLTDAGGRNDKDGADSEKSLARFDPAENPVAAEYAGEPNKQRESTKWYPKGNKIGNALHEIFEKIDFVSAGASDNSMSFSENSKVRALIVRCLESESFHIEENDGEKTGKGWVLQTADFVWNTLNASFPELRGNQRTERLFSLCEISRDDHISEAEFNMVPELSSAGKTVLKNYCNGFIDLVFRRGDVYSVLDWKSDSIDFDDEAAGEKSVHSLLKEHTDSRYSIQRVLYSYCLVKWLKTFAKYKDLSEETIFQNHFGGMYYVYVRYCRKGTSQGIYARTWKSWDDLKLAFENICTELIRGR